MLILAVDTSTHDNSLAVVRDVQTIGLVTSPSQGQLSSGLFADLEGLLRDVSLTLPQFALFAVAAGPGSFTGLRVGLTAVKAWAEVFQKPVAAVGTIEAIAAQSKISFGLVAAFFTAGRGQVYGGLYEKTQAALERRADDVVLSPEEYLEFILVEVHGAPVSFVSSTPNALAPAISDSAFRGVSIEPVSGVLAPIVGRLGYSRAMQNQLVDAYTLDANYVRRSGAELHLQRPASKASRA